jgi:DNA-binding transcriptional ArsR family regulator
MSAIQALADPIRMEIVELLAKRDMSAGEIASHFAISAPAVSRHLRVLRTAGLASVRVDAQRRIYRLNPAPFAELSAWARLQHRMAEQRLDALGAHLDRVASRERKKEKGHGRSTSR